MNENAVPIQPKGAKEFEWLCIIFIKHLYTIKWHNMTRPAGCLYVYTEFIIFVFVKLKNNLNIIELSPPMILLSNLLNEVKILLTFLKKFYLVF